jgi:hypothetical protein
MAFGDQGIVHFECGEVFGVISQGIVVIADLAARAALEAGNTT